MNYTSALWCWFFFIGYRFISSLYIKNICDYSVRKRFLNETVTLFCVLFFFFISLKKKKSFNYVGVAIRKGKVKMNWTFIDYFFFSFQLRNCESKWSDVHFTFNLLGCVNLFIKLTLFFFVHSFRSFCWSSCAHIRHFWVFSLTKMVLPLSKISSRPMKQRKFMKPDWNYVKMHQKMIEKRLVRQKMNWIVHI